MPRGIPGPVKRTDGPVKQTKKNPGLGNHGNLPGPGPGRPKGSLNKFTGDVRTALLEGLNSAHPEGLAGFIRDAARESPTAGMSLAGRFVPQQVEQGKPGDFSKLTDSELERDIAATERAIAEAKARAFPSLGEAIPEGAGRLN